MSTRPGAYDEFRGHPSPEALVRLLGECQHGVYNICFQVLRHEHDAEDATQQILLEIVDGIGAIADGSHFTRWMHRVALHTALDFRRKRARQADHEQRKAAMTPDPAPFQDPGLHRALCEAIYSLDDEDRSLILSHYFEKRTLEDLARDAGISTVAVWKRIDRVRSTLQNLVVATTAGATAGAIVPMLEGMTPVRTPINLVTPGLAAKAAAFSGAGAALALGGTLVTTKMLLSIPVIAAALAILLAGGIGGYWIGARNGLVATASSPAPEGETLARLEAARGEAARWEAEARKAKEALAAVASPVPAAPAGTPEPSDLTQRLRKFKEFVTRMHEEAMTRESTMASDPEASKAFIDELDARVNQESQGLKDLIFRDPLTFLAFAKDASNTDCLFFLMRLLEDRTRTGPSRYTTRMQPCSSVPAALMDGLVGMTRAATSAEKQSVLQFLAMVDGQPDRYKDAYLALLSDPSPQVQAGAINCLQHVEGGTLPAESMPTLRRMAESASDPYLQHVAASAIARAKSPEAEEFTLGLLEASGSEAVLGALAFDIQARILTSKPDQHDRYARAVAAAITRSREDTTLQNLMLASLNLPLSRAATLLEQAAGRSSSARQNEAIQEILKRLRDGETRPDTLKRVLYDLNRDEPAPPLTR